MAVAKRLYRSREDKIVAGVCGGMGEYFNIDPVWIRIIFVLLTILDGLGLLIYIIAWVLMPLNPVQKATKDTFAEQTVDKVVKNFKEHQKHAKSIKSHKEDMHSTFEHKHHEHSGALLFGTILVIVGVAFSLKYFLKSFNMMLVWPIILILIGLYLIFRRLE